MCKQLSKDNSCKLLSSTRYGGFLVYCSLFWYRRKPQTDRITYLKPKFLYADMVMRSILQHASFLVSAHFSLKLRTVLPRTVTSRQMEASHRIHLSSIGLAAGSRIPFRHHINRRVVASVFWHKLIVRQIALAVAQIVLVRLLVESWCFYVIRHVQVGKMFDFSFGWYHSFAWIAVGFLIWRVKWFWLGLICWGVYARWFLAGGGVCF